MKTLLQGSNHERIRNGIYPIYAKQVCNHLHIIIIHTSAPTASSVYEKERASEAPGRDIMSDQPLIKYGDMLNQIGRLRYSTREKKPARTVNVQGKETRGRNLPQGKRDKANYNRPCTDNNSRPAVETKYLPYTQKHATFGLSVEA
jgi:hypothetical protein